MLRDIYATMMDMGKGIGFSLLPEAPAESEGRDAAKPPLVPSFGNRPEASSFFAVADSSIARNGGAAGGIVICGEVGLKLFGWPSEWVWWLWWL